MDQLAQRHNLHGPLDGDIEQSPQQAFNDRLESQYAEQSFLVQGSFLAGKELYPGCHGGMIEGFEREERNDRVEEEGQTTRSMEDTLYAYQIGRYGDDEIDGSKGEDVNGDTQGELQYLLPHPESRTTTFLFDLSLHSAPTPAPHPSQPTPVNQTLPTEVSPWSTYNQRGTSGQEEQPNHPCSIDISVFASTNLGYPQSPDSSFTTSSLGTGMMPQFETTPDTSSSDVEEDMGASWHTIRPPIYPPFVPSISRSTRPSQNDQLNVTTMEDQSGWIENSSPHSGIHPGRGLSTNPYNAKSENMYQSLSVDEERINYSSPAISPAPGNSGRTFLLCEICGTRFQGDHSRGNLARHHRIQHGGQNGGARTFLCNADNCERVFKRKDSRLKHERRWHPELELQGPEKRPQSWKYPRSTGTS